MDSNNSENFESSTDSLYFDTSNSTHQEEEAGEEGEEKGVDENDESVSGSQDPESGEEDESSESESGSYDSNESDDYSSGSDSGFGTQEQGEESSGSEEEEEEESTVVLNESLGSLVSTDYADEGNNEANNNSVKGDSVLDDKNDMDSQPVQQKHPISEEQDHANLGNHDDTVIDQTDDKQQQDKDATPSLSPEKRRESLVQTVVQQWENPSPLKDAKNTTESSKNVPRDLPEELPHVKGIVDDMNLTSEQIRQLKEQEAMAVQLLKQQTAAERELRKQQQQQQQGEQMAETQQDVNEQDENKTLQQQQQQDFDDKDHTQEQQQDEGEDLRQSAARIREERLQQIEQQRLQKSQKRSWGQSVSSSLRSLFGRKDKQQKEEDQSPSPINEESSLQLGNEEGKKQQEEENEDQEMLPGVPENSDGNILVPYSGDRPVDDNDDDDGDVEANAIIAVQEEQESRNLDDPLLDNHSSDEGNLDIVPLPFLRIDDDNDDDDQQQQDQDDTQGGDDAEVEPFLDEEHGLEHDLEQPPHQEEEENDDKDDRAMEELDDGEDQTPNSQVPCAFFVVALIVGEVVGVAVGWYVWVN